MALPACAYGGRKTSYLHDTHQTTSQPTVPSSEVEIEVALRCGAGQRASQWWEGTGSCHGSCEEFWQSLRVERGSAGEKEAARKTRRSCKLGGREGCCWSTSDGSPWRSAACWAWSSGRGGNSAGCVQQENWNRGMYSEGSYCLKRQRMLQHMAHYCVQKQTSVKTVKSATLGPNLRSGGQVQGSGRVWRDQGRGCVSGSQADSRWRKPSVEDLRRNYDWCALLCSPSRASLRYPVACGIAKWGGSLFILGGSEEYIKICVLSHSSKDNLA